MDDIPLSLLFGLLVFLLLCSAFFSSSETGMMALNRYRLRHQVRRGNRAARITNKLLETPDRLIGVILLGNNFVNILASSIATVIAMRTFGEVGIPIAALLLTLVVLIFAEVAPKTLAALHPETVAFRAALPLKLLLKIFYPLVWAINVVTNGLLRLFGTAPEQMRQHALSPDELRVAVKDAGKRMPQQHRDMLLGILDLERVSVEDIMVPRTEVVGIDLEDDWNDILKQLRQTEYTRLPVYEGDLDQVRGMLHLRNLATGMMHGDFDRETLVKSIDPPYFVPEGASLSVQLVNFQRAKRRVALVVDEYGDVRGMVTLEDLLEQIVGEFTTDAGEDATDDIRAVDNGEYLIDGSATIREVNRAVGWELPTRRGRTINGLILETMETIPNVGTCFLINGYPIEVVQTQGNAVRTVRVSPRRPMPDVDREFH